MGAITWRAAAKVPDYALLAAFVVGAVGAWLALTAMTRRLERRWGMDSAGEFLATLGFCSLPFVAWFGAQIVRATLPFDLVRLSAAALVLVVVTTVVSMRSRASVPDALIRWPRIVVTAATLGALWLPIFIVGANRLQILGGARPVWSGWPGFVWLAIGGASVAVLLSVTLRRQSASRARHLFGALQLSLPWAFMAILPNAWIDASGSIVTVPTYRLPIVAFALVALAYADLMWRWFGGVRRAERQWTAVLSPVCLAGVILLFQLPVLPPGQIPLDDYHFGEWAVPWWTWASDGLLPFRDFVPARGMNNYTDGAIATLLGDGSAAMIHAAMPAAIALVFVAAFTATAGLVGALPAAGMFALLPLGDRVTDIDLAMTALLMLAWRWFYATSALRWLIGWTMAAIPAFLYAPGQALLVLMATTPLVAWQIGRAALGQPRTLRLWGGALIAILVAAVVTPLGAMLWGAWLYVVENAGIVNPSYGIEWRLSLGTLGANHWALEAARAAFAAVPMVAAVLLGGRALDRDWRTLGRIAVIAVPVLILGLMYIPRAAGRIDPGAPSRLAIASVWMHAALLPVLLHVAWGARRWASILAIAAFVLGSVSALYGGFNLRVLGARALPAGAMPGTVVRGETFGLPALGVADIDAAQLTRLARLRRALDALLDPDETYLDFTNRNTNYFYFDRMVPVESSALYNMPSETQQLRSIERLKADPVPLILASADSMLHDGGPASLREHAFYRYAVQHYTPARVDGYIFLLRPDRVSRAAQLGSSRVDLSQSAALLDEAFLPPSLEAIPAAWGKAWEELSDNALFVRALPNDRAGEWSLDPPVAGHAAGLFLLEMQCGRENDPGAEMAVSWTAENDSGVVRFRAGSRLVIPLDAAPRWLLAREITSLRLQPSNAGCGPIQRAELWQRRIAAVTDPE